MAGATTPVPFCVRVVSGGVSVQSNQQTTVVVQDTTVRVVNVGGAPGPTGPAGPAGTPSPAVETTINGQPMLTLIDTTRSSKVLSVAEQPLLFSENRLTNDDWIRPGHANDADSGYGMDFDGTIVYCTGECENTGANSKDIHLYIEGVDQGSAGTLSGGANAAFTNTVLNLDFSRGDKIRARAEGTGGAIQDTVIKVTLKWRG